VITAFEVYVAPESAWAFNQAELEAGFTCLIEQTSCDLRKPLGQEIEVHSWRLF
jgi:hypothetical protein